MNLITYLFLGFITAVIGALPLGTTNIAVINTTIKENIRNAFKIVYTAAIAELILVLIALSFNTQIEDFIGMNTWLQYTIAVILLVVGIVLLAGRKECIKDENEECIIIKKRGFTPSKQLLGFILGLVNPTVLIYWILVISILKKEMIYLDINMETSILILFLIGIFLGKLSALYSYARFSHILKLKIKDIVSKINRVIGVLLTVISIFQFVKLFFY